MNAACLPSTADVLLKRIIYLVAKEIIRTGNDKHPVLEVYRDKLIATLCVDHLDTITRLLKVLVLRGYIIKLAQFKDFDNHKFGGVVLVPGGRIWAQLRAKVEELRARGRRHAEKAKKGKNPSKNRPTFLQTISSLSENKEGRREKEKKRQRLKAQEDREIARLDLAAQNNDRADKIPTPNADGPLLKTVVHRE